MSHQRLAKSLPPIICIVQISPYQHTFCSPAHPTFGLSFGREDYVAPFSINSFASLIFVAKYGLPPRSGWFSSIICRCFLRIISRVAPRSLYQNSPVSIVSICPKHTRQPLCCNSWEGEGKTYEVSRINAASRLVICFSNPPL